MSPTNSSPKPERLRQEELTNRLPGSPHREPDGLYFDWEPPELARPLVLTFMAEIRPQKGSSRIRFQIDLAKLVARTADLEKLHAILALRHAGLDSRQTLLRSIEWLLTISLEQTAPPLTDSERRLKARAMVAFTRTIRATG